MTENVRTGLRGLASRNTDPGLSLRDLGTRALQRYWKPGDKPLRNAFRVGRGLLEGAAIVATGGAAAGPILANAGRQIVAGELVEGAAHTARSWWDRASEARRQGRQPQQESGRGRTWPTDTGPPAPGVSPSFRPAPGMGIMPSPEGVRMPSNAWVNGSGEATAPRFSWESDANGDERRPYGEGQGMYPQSEEQSRRFRAPGRRGGAGVRGGQAVGGSQAEQRAIAQAFIQQARDPGNNQRTMGDQARRAMDQMFRGAEK